MDGKWAADQQPPWIACCQNDLTADKPSNRFTHQATTLTNKRRQWRTCAEHHWLKSGPPLMRDWTFIRTALFESLKLTFGLRVGCISSHLTVDKPFSVNPRAITGPPKMSLLREAKSIICQKMTNHPPSPVFNNNNITFSLAYTPKWSDIPPPSHLTIFHSFALVTTHNPSILCLPPFLPLF